MNGPVPATPRSSFDSFVLNIVTLVAWWMLLGTGIRTVFPHGFPSDPSGLFVGETTILIACVLGTFGALAIRRNGAAYVLAGFVAYGAVELCFHGQFGGRTVQGGPAHFADLAAGILAVTFSVLVERRAVNAAQTPVWNARAIGDSAFRAGVAIRKSAGYGAHAALGLAAFAVSEVSIRIVYGWISYLSGYGWRVRHLFLDSETNYAILACALLGAVLGAAIEKWGDYLTIRVTRRSESFEAGGAESRRDARCGVGMREAGCRGCSMREGCGMREGFGIRAPLTRYQNPESLPYRASAFPRIRDPGPASRIIRRSRIPHPSYIPHYDGRPH